MKKSIATAFSLLALVGMVGCGNTAQGTAIEESVTQVVEAPEDGIISTIPLGVTFENDNKVDYYEHTFKLSDGREVTCISSSTGNASVRGLGAGLTCDWESATVTEEAK